MCTVFNSVKDLGDLMVDPGVLGAPMSKVFKTKATSQELTMQTFEGGYLRHDLPLRKCLKNDKIHLLQVHF